MASGNTTVITTVSNLSELHKKTNTEMQVALKRKSEELDWFKDLPDLKLIPSGNEMRLVLDVSYQPDTTAAIPDGGFEGVQTTQAPNHGVLTFTQLNFRYSFTTLYQAFKKNGRAGMIQDNTLFASIKAVEQFARKIALQTYGFSTGTKAVVAATMGSSSITQNGVQLKNAYGSTLIPGNATADKTYLSFIFRTGDPIALIRAGALVEFGTVAASPSAGSGVGYLDFTFNSAITPTSGDLIIAAAAVTDATLTATDQNRWPVGFLDILTSASLHGLATAPSNNWAAGYADTTGGRMSFSRAEQLANNLWNNGGVKLDRWIWSQGVRRDTIAGERGAMVYNSSTFNLDGDAGRKGVKDYTSVLTPTGMVIGWNSDCVMKKTMSELPGYEGGPEMFELDKMQDRGAYNASFNFVQLKACVNRAGVGYLSSLQEQ